MLFFRHAMWISIGIFLGRLAGFVRESALAARFGTSVEADIAVVLLTVPQMLVNLLMAGALSVALIPEFKRLGPGPRSSALFWQGSVITAIVFVIISAMIGYHADLLLALVAPGLDTSSGNDVSALMGWVLWVLPLTALAGLSTAYLQANDRFLVAALGTFIFNITLVIAIFFLLEGQKPLAGLVLAILFAALLRWFAQLLRLPRQVINLRMMRWKLVSRPLMKRYFQALGAGGLITLIPVIARAFASTHGEGSMAVFNYAHKLVEFPVGSVLTVLAVAIFPVFSQAFARKQDISQPLKSALRWISVLSLSLFATLFIYRHLMADLVFGWGRMSDADVSQVALLFGAGLLVLPLQGVSSLLQALFNARLDTAIPLKVNLAALVLFLPLAFFASQRHGLMGIMLALVAVYVVILVAQVILLKKHYNLNIFHYFDLSRTVLMIVLTLGLSKVAVLIRDGVEIGTTGSLLVAALTGALMLILSLVALGERKILLFWKKREPFE